MNNETFLDFCFIRAETGHFKSEINDLLREIFSGINLNWYLEEKMDEGAEIVIAEVKGMSRWRTEAETIAFLEEQAGDKFWEFLQGYQIYIYPVVRGCNSCGTH